MGLFSRPSNPPVCPECGAVGYEVTPCLSCHTRGVFNGGPCEECAGAGFRMTPCARCGGGGMAVSAEL